MSVTITIDKGASTPIDTVDVSGVTLDETLFPIARFGVQVDAPTGGALSFNFVELNGTVGITNPLVTTSAVRLTVSRIIQPVPNVDGIEEFRFAAVQTLTTRLVGIATPFGFDAIGFSFTDGGISEEIPEGYYAYVLYASLEDLVTIPVLPGPFVSGPIQFTGTSYVKNS